jgi:ribose 1,5-bisphosphokinase PhnN
MNRFLMAGASALLAISAPAMGVTYGIGSPIARSLTEARTKGPQFQDSPA